MTKIRQQWGFFLCALFVAFTAYGGMARMQWLHGTLRDEHTPETIGYYLLAFAAFLGALAWVEKRHVSMRWVWAGAPGFGPPLPVAKMIVAAVMVVVLFRAWLLAGKRPSPRPTLRLMTIPLGATILLTPTVHPWHALLRLGSGLPE